MSSLSQRLLLLLALSLPAQAERVELYFHIDRDAAKEIDTDAKAEAAAEEAAPVLLKRLSAADIQGVQLAQMKHQIRITLDADEETRDRVWHLATSIGKLEFLIEAGQQGTAADDVPGTHVVRFRAAIPELEAPWIRVRDESGLDASHVTSAAEDSSDAGLVVKLTLDDAGKEAFAEWTKKCVGKRLAIVVDGIVVTAPVIRETITSGEAAMQLTRDVWTESDARDLVAILRSGPLPAPLKLVDEKR